MVLSAMGLNWGLWVFADHTHANTKQICPWSTCAMQCLTGVYLQAQTTVDAGNILTYASDEPWLFWLRKNLKTPNLSPCQDKNGAGFGISHVYICEKFTTKFHTCTDWMGCAESCTTAKSSSVEPNWIWPIDNTAERILNISSISCMG